MPNPKRPAYPVEFRAEAVRLARVPGHTIEGVARDLGVARELVGQKLSAVSDQARPALVARLHG